MAGRSATGKRCREGMDAPRRGLRSLTARGPAPQLQRHFGSVMVLGDMAMTSLTAWMALSVAVGPANR